ncbi:MAG: multicopper oxidase domain-containing protein [bacterium]
MGAGVGPDGVSPYKQNRATLHLHGGATPWISDGTPHQWTTPAGESTVYPKGVSVTNVPDMPDPGPGGMTFYWTNQQSSRLMFFHDHVYGITRLNVYVGEAAGYVIQDPVEDALVAGNYIPAEQIPLIIQDKTFVDAATIGDTDPTWRWGTGADGDGNGYPDFKTGDLWVPHVYMPAQNPADLSGMAPMGRWHYGPWFWPPVTDIQHGPVPNPYYDSWFAGDIDPNGVPYLSDGPATRPWEPKYMPGVPDPSVGMEHYNDTPLVNGTAYPTLTVDPKAYRFRILNAANDRFFNLQFYVADPAVSVPDPQRSSPLTEVKMVPACNDGSLPVDWPMDGREGGVPDPALKGPDWIQIGTEGGFLPAPAVIPARPITWNWDQTTFNMGNVIDHSLLLGCAERADVIVDFSGYAGKTLILYNDAPVAFPALDPRQDYYTGMPDMRDTGSHWPTLPGFGPNVRTVMQIIVRADAVVDPWLGQTALETEWASATGHPGVFERAQDPILVGQSAYDSAYTRPIGKNPDKLFPAASPWWGYSGISTTSLPFETLDGTRLSIPMARKALHDEMGGVYDQWGRMSGKLGTEVPGTNALTQAFSPLAYMDPSTEILVNNTTATLLTPVLGDGTQIWKFTHNGVDTHPIHFHLFNVQLVNRVGWDGAIRLPDANELGWKETIRVSPLEDTIVAMRPYAPDIPFKIPDSVRLLDPTMPVGATWQSWDPVTGNGPVIISNAPYNYGWEYMLHCHVLSHEEMEMMRPIDFLVSPAVPSSLTAVWGGSVDLAWTNNSTVPAATNLLIQRATDADFTLGVAEFSVADPAATAFVDTTVELGITYYYRLRAENTISYSAWSNTSSILTPVPTPPAAPTNLAAVLQAGPQIQLTWMDNATNETGFVIERSVNGGAFAQLAAPGPLTGTGNVTYLDTTVVAGNSYAYRVYAKNGTLSSAYSNTVTVVLRLPVAPSNLVATLNAGSQVSLTFRDNSNIETVFIMERSVNGGAFVQLVALAANAGTGNVTYLDTTVAVGNTYAYRVKAVAGALSSAYSNTASVSVILLAPTNLVATLNAVTQVSLTFRDNSTIETGFIMERSVNGGAFSQIAARGPRNGTGGVTYVDTTVAAGNTYAYRVMAVAGAISSAYTNTATVVVPSLPAAPTNVTVTAAIRNNTNARITLNWTDVATNNTGYTVQYSLDPNFVPIGGTATLGANAITYRTGNVARGTTFYLRVRAFNLGGTSAWVTISITTP